MTGSDPLTSLADEIGRMSRRLAALGEELRRESAARVAASAAPAPAEADQRPEPEPPRAAGWQPAPAPPEVRWAPQRSHDSPWPLPTRTPAPSLFERLSRDGAGSRLLAWVGGAITTLGVVMLLVLAVQRGYLGPVPRVVGGALLGVALIAVGVRLHRSPTSRTGAFALAATGFAVLYLDVVAITSIYGYLPPVGGLVAGLLVAGAGLLLAMRWDSATFAIGVVAACAVCAPVLTEGFTLLLVAFLLVLKVAAAPVHLKRDWPPLAVVAGVPPLVAVLAAVPGEDLWTVNVVALVAAVVGVAGAALTARFRPADRTAIGLLVGAPAPALLVSVLLDRPQSAVVAAGAAVPVLAVWALGRGRLPSAFTAAAGGVGVLALFQATATALEGSTRAAAVLAEAALLAFLATRLRSRGPLVGAVALGGVGGVLVLGDALPLNLLLEPWRFTAPTTEVLVAGLLAGLVLLVTAVVVAWAATAVGVLDDLGDRLVAWICVGVVGLYAVAGVVLCSTLLVSRTVTGFLFGHTIVTISWAVAALVLLIRGIDVPALRACGLVLVGAAVMKLLLFDLAALSGFARVLAFLGAGLVLLTAGTRYAKLVATRRISANS
ncbi:DUF2339 domain-containing protein [Saccharothrix coeruleofusca]|nr:DUF2339 domain-containing protein [Saccharothrix coeruleofusca]